MTRDSAPRLVSILRRPGGLSAVVSAKNPSYAPNSAEPPYVEKTFALADIPEAICPWRDRDVKAWRALRSVPSIGRRAATTITRSLIGSVVSPDVSIAHLDEIDFRRPVNLQPYLCSADGEQAVLLLIADTVALATQDTELPTWHLSHRQQIVALPAEFRRTFLWGLHLSPWSRLEQTLELYTRLGLDDNGALRSAIARMLTSMDREVGLQCLAAIVETPLDKRLDTAREFIEGGPQPKRPDHVANRMR